VWTASEVKHTDGSYPTQRRQSWRYLITRRKCHDQVSLIKQWALAPFLCRRGFLNLEDKRWTFGCGIRSTRGLHLQRTTHGNVYKEPSPDRVLKNVLEWTTIVQDVHNSAIEVGNSHLPDFLKAICLYVTVGHASFWSLWVYFVTTAGCATSPSWSAVPWPKF
jgi:hypothetical protein